jgi:Protein of unknown function (DUF3000)
VPTVNPAAVKSWETIVAEIRAITVRNEVVVEEVPAPQKLAPHALALTADVDIDVGTGRFVLLHDPAGQEGWSGEFRCVTFARAAIEEELANDPSLCDVSWAWLLESLAAHSAEYAHPSGTVTRVASSSYGELDGREEDSEVEVRASWTPIDGNSLTSHVKAWLTLLERVSGLEPLAEGITQLPRSK